MYLYNEALFSNKKKWSANPFYNMKEPRKQQAKQEKSVTKTLCDFIYMEYQNR